MRLTTVRIEGFRSIKRPLDLIVDARTTVLLGPNDHGKTNILLALTHLHPNQPLGPDDRNWDLPADKHPRLVFTLEMSDQDRRRAVTAWTNANSTATAAERPKLADIPSQLTLVREGVDPEMSIEGPSPPDVLKAEILSLVPRVELFQAAPSIPDSATAAEITEPTHEFIQGIFLYAGLKREEWPPLFDQTDATLKRLEVASKQLNKILRRDWTQGQDLQFELRHDSATSRIALHLKDPAVRSRWVRASQRSAGFTHYFSLRTRMHARTGGKRQGLYLWLFDEPGVWLHPAGQFDLMQALEGLAKTSQVVYATHSVFLINRNFPARHRLVVKKPQGTELDAKPFVSRWSAALDALGFSISGTLLFAPCVVLAEGDSDPVLLYPLLQKLAAAGLWDRDINSLSIMATGDLRNAEAIARLLLQGAHRPRIAVLVDGDKGGLARARGLSALADEKQVMVITLPGGKETEDYIPDKAAYVRAVAETAAFVAKTDAAAVVAELDRRYQAWSVTPEGGVGVGRWAGEQAKEIVGLEETPSKVVVARAWAQAIVNESADRQDLTEGLRLAEWINDAVKLPARATEGGLF